MTAERLYFDNAYLRSFTARVTNHTTKNGRPAVALDRTAFYPEGGGQPGDQGTLNGVRVVDTQSDDAGEVWHLLDGPLEANEVDGQIDWRRRFDWMQQHHGQHLLSAAFEQCLNARTVSVHFGEEICTLDLDRPALTGEEVEEVEELANQMIWADVPVLARFVTGEELQTIPLRRPPKAYERIRIVSAGDFDHSACGGTHPRRTGEVGCLVIRRWERYKSGVRVEFICGGRIVKDYRNKQQLLSELGTKLSVGTSEIPAAIERLQAAEERQRKMLEQTQKQLLEYEVRALIETAERINGIPVVTQSFEDRSVDNIRALARRIAELEGIALLGLRADKAQFIFTRSADAPYDMRELLQVATGIVGGRGGGRPEAAQGGGPAVDQLDQALQAALKHLKQG
jgi:alanyl-tRNA synthetase